MKTKDSRKTSPLPALMHIDAALKIIRNTRVESLIFCFHDIDIPNHCIFAFRILLGAGYTFQTISRMPWQYLYSAKTASMSEKYFLITDSS